ncbi:MAG: aldo/keto reductase, partial [Proteobacteria bacterium]|nr:aldo/keto reductase [Pseudomonadota bacterium]
YFESARAYAGSEAYLGQALGRDRERVFLATKSHHRRDRGARAHLEESLALLRTDWIDLWYVHDVRTREDLDAIAGLGGALQTFAKAREGGLVRFVGISGHQDPEVLREALDLFDFDCVLLPVNPAEASADSFAEVVLPVARGRNLGIIAMKTLCRGLVAKVPGYAGTAPFLRYALATQGVTLASVGCDHPRQLEENAAAAASLVPLPPAEREALEQRLYAHSKELLYYRP